MLLKRLSLLIKKRMHLTIGIIGIGCVGTAMQHSISSKKNVTVFVYDKYKKIGSLESCLKTDICFLTLPTKLNSDLEYNLQPLRETLIFLSVKKYEGLVVIKSTVTPTTSQNFNETYQNLQILHNPEFLSAKTAFQDFHHQTHIVIGKTSRIKNAKVDTLREFYNIHYSDADISICLSEESEMMKICCNSFYASKIQLMTEFFSICKIHGISYDTVKYLMLKNSNISNMHTDVPGHDGQISFGGACFPKDITAFITHIKKNDGYHTVLSSVIEEQKYCRRSGPI